MMDLLQSEIFANLAYIIASMLFIFGLKQLGSPETAQRGNLISSSGMLLAVLVTLISNQIISYEWLVIGLVLGTLVGASAASFVKMTSMPELVALFNGFGGIASLLVGSAEYLGTGSLGLISLTAIFLTLIIGGITFSGSLVAYGKLSEILPGKQITFKGQRIVLVAIFIAALLFGAQLIFNFQMVEGWNPLFSFLLLISFALVIGLLITLPIGGADMPVIIALLNSYSGLAASAAGFVINNNVLIVAGALVGASGLILTNIMCKAMNRSLANVVFGSIASSSSGAVNPEEVGEIKPINVSDAYLILEAANSVLVVPGYGMAVSQAQHAVRELGELLEENGCEVNYAIHPVAGRMPGHMNVLLAEANVSYDEVFELEEINSDFSTCDVAFVIGANDITNPAAKTDPSSPIAGMPILDVENAKTVLFVKRSLSPGYAGIDNKVFYNANTLMLFGDAKKIVEEIVKELD